MRSLMTALSFAVAFTLLSASPGSSQQQQSGTQNTKKYKDTGAWGKPYRCNQVARAGGPYYGSGGYVAAYRRCMRGS
jgi:hypothetical protein